MPAAALILAATHLGALALLAFAPAPFADFPRFAFAVLVAAAAWIAFSARYLFGSRVAPRAVVLVGVAAAIAGRALLLVPDAPLSDDLYRYLWDGRVANAGINPFAHAPSAPQLDALRNEVAARVNHPDISTIYPPVAQLAFRALDGLGAGPRGVRAAAAALDLAAVAVLAAALRRGGHSPRLALVHGLCPLAILESAGGGHVDALGVVLLAIACLASDRRPFFAGFFLGCAALVKLVPAALAPTFLVRRTPRAALALAAGGLASLLLTIPYLSAGPHLFDGLAAYSEHWRFHDALYTPLVRAGWDPLDARRLLAGAFAFVAAAAPWFLRDRLAACGLVFAAFLALSPTVHPWYALWLAPFLVVVPRWTRPAAFALAALLPLSYAAAWTHLNSGEWVEPAWSRALLWIPVGVLALAGAAREAISRRGPGGATPAPTSSSGEAPRRRS